MTKSKILKIIATIFGAICYLYGAGSIFLFPWGSNTPTLNASTILSLLGYFVGVFCFWYVSENRNWKFVIPTAIVFPFVVFGLFFGFSIAIDALFFPGAKGAPLFAVIPTIVVCSILFRYTIKRF